MRNSRGLKLWIAGIVVLLVSVFAAWKVYASRAPKLTASGEKIRSFVASDKFKELPGPVQKQYADQMMKDGPAILKNGELSPEQEKAMMNMAGVHRQAMLDEYFKLPEGKARKDYLDKQIDQQEQIKKLMENPPTTKPGDGMRVVMRKGGGGSAAAQKQMAENVPPDQQAKMAQFVQDLNARRAERGLPAGPGGIMIIRTQGPS